MRRFRGGRRPRQRLAWVRRVFNDSVLDATATLLLTEFVLLDVQSDMLAAVDKMNAGGYYLKRCIFTGSICMEPKVTSPDTNMVPVFWAVYVVDAEDNDASILVTTPGSLLASHRVIATGCREVMVNEVTNAAQTALYVYPGIDVDIDVRVNVKLKGDELLILGVQFGQADVSDTVLGASISGISSQLVVVP